MNHWTIILVAELTVVSGHDTILEMVLVPSSGLPRSDADMVNLAVLLLQNMEDDILDDTLCGLS